MDTVTKTRVIYQKETQDGVRIYERMPNGESFELIPDIPELDATDGAHPAWWRSHEHTVKTLCQKINDIIDGKDLGEGVSSEPWESVRRKLINSGFRPLRRDSLCPSGATLVSTMPAPSGFLGWATGEKISGFSRFLILIKYEKQK